MIYKSILRPLLFQFDPESCHHFAMQFLVHPITTKLLTPWTTPTDPSLKRELFGLTFRNPIGLAPGFDKNCLALPAWQNLGFGYMEIGTVTPGPQVGNPLPRIFRLPADKGLVNRLGFNNDGLEVITERFRKLKASGGWPTIPVGINIVKGKETTFENAPQDYLKVFLGVRPFADYIAVNVSSPNTKGIRDLQKKSLLQSILQPLVENNVGPDRKPILVKVAGPDLSEQEIDDILECLQENKIDGIIPVNTCVDKSAVSFTGEGGLSGAPIRERSTKVIRYVHKRTEGKLPIVVGGGIFTADDAQEKLDAGASLLQIYTSFIYEGPLIVKRICDGLVRKKR